MLVALFLATSAALAADLPRGRVIEDVTCAADATQSYALYLPSAYSPDRPWPLILAFDPAARGRIPVERFQLAAETYGYIVAGSNRSRNGSWPVSMAAAQTMGSDILARFAVDTKRIYTAGMSGGARVALGVALGSTAIAGVIASSAGYPDSKPRAKLPFAVFGTAGTEDFNNLEMRRLDRALSSPHRLAVFEGGHVWLSSALAVEAVEWMELQAMKSGRRPKDAALIDALYAKRTAAAADLVSEKDTCLALEAIAADFEGLNEVTGIADRAATLRRDKRVRDALKKDRDEENREQHQIDGILALENGLSSADGRAAALAQLRSRWKKLAATAAAGTDSPDRRIARRVLRGLSMAVAERTTDTEYRKIIDEFRPSRPGGG